MIKGRKVFVAVVAGLVLAGIGYADMIPAVRSDAGPELALSDRSASASSAVCDLLFDETSADVSLLLYSSLPIETGDQLAQGSEDVCIRADRQDSLGLCLYTLLGLGLCRSLPLVKKVSFGYIPQWYHDGGPVQIGHSHAVSPDCLCRVMVSSLVQPHCGAGQISPSYRQEMILVLWRRSQFTRFVLASRAPPLKS